MTLLLCISLMQRLWKNAVTECLKKKIPVRIKYSSELSAFFQSSLVKLLDYSGEQKKAQKLNNSFLLQSMSEFRHIPGIWAHISEAGYLAETRLTFPAS